MNNLQSLYSIASSINRATSCSVNGLISSLFHYRFWYQLRSISGREYHWVSTSGPHLTDSHPTPGHQFQHQPVANIVCPENDFIDGVFFNNVPMDTGFRPEQFTQHRGITWIFEIAIEVISHEIEKGGQVGKTNPLCLGFQAIGEFRHKIQNIIWRYLLRLRFAKFWLNFSMVDW